MLFLCKFPEVQESLYEEIVTVIGAKVEPDSQSIWKMPKFNAFLHEVLRYVSLIPQGVPHSTTEPIKLAGYDVPADTSIFINQYAIHKDKRYWKHADEFNIDNFMDDEGKFNCPPQFMPFGWGKRQCLGSALARAEMFVMVVKILGEFKLSFPSTGYTMEAYGDIIRRPPNQKIVFTKRT